MYMYNFIANPKSKKYYKTNSIQGKKILYKYLNYIILRQNGGMPTGINEIDEFTLKQIFRSLSKIIDEYPSEERNKVLEIRTTEQKFFSQIRSRLLEILERLNNRLREHGLTIIITGGFAWTYYKEEKNRYDTSDIDCNIFKLKDYAVDISIAEARILIERLVNDIISELEPVSIPIAQPIKQAKKVFKIINPEDPDNELDVGEKTRQERMPVEIIGISCISIDPRKSGQEHIGMNPIKISTVRGLGRPIPMIELTFTEDHNVPILPDDEDIEKDKDQIFQYTSLLKLSNKLFQNITSGSGSVSRTDEEIFEMLNTRFVQALMERNRRKSEKNWMAKDLNLNLSKLISWQGQIEILLTHSTRENSEKREKKRLEEEAKKNAAAQKKIEEDDRIAREKFLQEEGNKKAIIEAKKEKRIENKKKAEEAAAKKAEKAAAEQAAAEQAAIEKAEKAAIKASIKAANEATIQAAKDKAAEDKKKIDKDKKKREELRAENRRENAVQKREADEKKRIEIEAKQQEQDRKIAEEEEKKQMVLSCLEKNHPNEWYNKSSEKMRQLLLKNNITASAKYITELKKLYTTEKDKIRQAKEQEKMAREAEEQEKKAREDEEQEKKAKAAKKKADKEKADLVRKTLLELEGKSSSQEDKLIHYKKKMDEIFDFIFVYFFSTPQYSKKNYKSREEFENALSTYRYKHIDIQIPRIGSASKASDIFRETMDKKKLSTNQIKNNVYLIIEMGSRLLNIVTGVNFEKDQVDILGIDRSEVHELDNKLDILRFDKFLEGNSLFPKIQKLEDFIEEKREISTYSGSLADNPKEIVLPDNSESQQDSRSKKERLDKSSISDPQDAVYPDFILWKVVSKILSIFYSHGLDEINPSYTKKQQLMETVSKILKWAEINKHKILEPIGIVEQSARNLIKRRKLPMLSFNDIVDSSFFFITIATHMVNKRVRVLFKEELIIGSKSGELLETIINIDEILSNLSHV